MEKCSRFSTPSSVTPLSSLAEVTWKCQAVEELRLGNWAVVGSSHLTSTPSRWPASRGLGHTGCSSSLPVHCGGQSL